MPEQTEETYSTYKPESAYHGHGKHLHPPRVNPGDGRLTRGPDAPVVPTEFDEEGNFVAPDDSAHSINKPQYEGESDAGYKQRQELADSWKQHQSAAATAKPSGSPDDVMLEAIEYILAWMRPRILVPELPGFDDLHKRFDKAFNAPGGEDDQPSSVATSAMYDGTEDEADSTYGGVHVKQPAIPNVAEREEVRQPREPAPVDTSGI